MPRRDIQGVGLTENLVSSAARTTSGDSGPISGWAGSSKARVQFNVTAAAGTTPTLDVVLEDTVDGTNWNVIGTFAQMTGAGREVLNITSLFTDTLRVRWTIAGAAPSFTFAVDAYSE